MGAQYETDILAAEEKNGSSGKDLLFTSHLIEKYSFKNVVSESDGNHKSYKMRHAQGAQPKKFGELMFDAIDKILLPKDTKYEELEISKDCFKKLSQAEVLLVIRQDPKVREALKSVCVDQKWGDDMSKNNTSPWDGICKEKKFSSQVEGSERLKKMLLELYPNKLAPSDPPPVGSTVYLKL